MSNEFSKIKFVKKLLWILFENLCGSTCSVFLLLDLSNFNFHLLCRPWRSKQIWQNGRYRDGFEWNEIKNVQVKWSALQRLRKCSGWNRCVLICRESYLPSILFVHPYASQSQNLLNTLAYGMNLNIVHCIDHCHL
jgi:hypothetical protein